MKALKKEKKWHDFFSSKRYAKYYKKKSRPILLGGGGEGGLNTLFRVVLSVKRMDEWEVPEKEKKRERMGDLRILEIREG